MVNEVQLEQFCLDWFKESGYDYVCGYDIAPDSDAPERTDYTQVILNERLLSSLRMINPHIPTSVLEQVIEQ